MAWPSYESNLFGARGDDDDDHGYCDRRPRQNYNYIENREVIEIIVKSLSIYLVYVLNTETFYIYMKFDESGIQEVIDFYKAFLI